MDSVYTYQKRIGGKTYQINSTTAEETKGDFQEGLLELMFADLSRQSVQIAEQNE